MTDTLIKDVSDTAFWVANYRALETERADALFRDPLARHLSEERGKKIAATMPMSAMIGWMVVIRTCIIDDYIKFAIAQGVDTIVNLGAGLDTRPYRMDLPESLRWVEADYPHVIEYKEQRLSGERPRCQLERVKIDLADLPERRKMLSSVNERAASILILTEGVVPYLSVEETASLADDLSALNHVSYWVVDYFSPEAHRRRQGMQRKMKNAPFKFSPKDWFGFFGEHGWWSKEIRYLPEESDRLGRPIPLPWRLKIVIKFRQLFLSTERRETFRKFAAYVILQPVPKGL
jgi:methyltransferase (TIGR00027 family)